jgi:hypothetical protein
VKGHVNVAGGAVMCLALDARAATRDVDAVFRPARAVMEAAARVAAHRGVPDTWLNDAVKAFTSDRGTWAPFLERAHLKLFVATPEYLLAMKCLALRTGEGYRDEDDVRYLLRNLGLTRYDEAAEILARYYPLEDFPQTALLALRELLSGP